MVKRSKTVKKGRKRSQKGGFLNSLKKMVGLSGGDESQIQQTQSPGFFGSVGNFFGNITQKGEELLTQGQGKFQEGLSAVGNQVNKGRESLGNAISGSPDQTSTASVEQMPAASVEQMPAVSVEQMPASSVEQMPAASVEQMPAASAPNAVGGRRKKTMKGGKSLGLTYYASPVSGLNVAKPTYWMTGGKRNSYKKRRNSKKSRKTRNKNR